MAAGKYSFVIEQGSTTDFTIIYKDSNGNPIDLQYYSAKMQIRPYVGSNDVIATLSSSLNDDGTGLNMSNAISGAIGIFIASCTSSQFTFNEAVYDLDVISGSDCPIVNRILEGKVKLSKEVTVV
jgi:hypothetical protein